MTPEASDPSQRRTDLEARLAQIEDEYWQLADPGWRLQMGRLQMRRRVGSQTFAKLFASFNIVLFIGGVVLSFNEGTLASLGIAIVVGTLFSVGSFLTEVWSQTVDRESERRNEQIREDMTELLRLRRGVVTELRALDRAEGEQPSTN
jgi:hypothetical protein